MMHPLFAAITRAHFPGIDSGKPIVGTPTAPGEVGREPASPASPGTGPTRCICAHPGQHAECSPCRCQEKTP